MNLFGLINGQFGFFGSATFYGNVTFAGTVTFSGQALFANGTAAAPSIAFASQNGTGFWYEATNRIHFSINGVNIGNIRNGGGSNTDTYFENPTGNYLLLNNAGSVVLTAGGTAQSITLTPSGTSATSYVNVVTSQTGTTDLTSRVLRLASNVLNGDTTIQFTDNVGYNGYIGMRSGHLNFGANTQTVQMRLASSGNLLLGGLTTDGTGVLQFPAGAGDNSSGLSFRGTTYLYSDGDGILNIRYASGTASLQFKPNSGNTSSISSTVSSDLIFKSGSATTALTLDSSQRTILAGALRFSMNYTAGVGAATGYLTCQDATGTTYKIPVLV